MGEEQLLQALLQHALNLKARGDIDSFKQLQFAPYCHYYIEEGNTELYLTMREAQVVLLSMMGKTAKEVSRRLGISFRTVEYYLENVKRKLDCDSKREAINRLLCSNFLVNLIEQHQKIRAAAECFDQSEVTITE